MSLKCKCGRAKYYDADVCSKCWNAPPAWNSDALGSGSFDSNTHIKCQWGNTKYADADCCDECYEKSRPYFDSRDG